MRQQRKHMAINGGVVERRTRAEASADRRSRMGHHQQCHQRDEEQIWRKLGIDFSAALRLRYDVSEDQLFRSGMRCITRSLSMPPSWMISRNHSGGSQGA